MNMNYKDVLFESAAIVNERGKDYGDIEPMFEDVAMMATIVLGKEIEKIISAHMNKGAISRTIVIGQK